MAGKRRADTDLNHDNWDQEDETEEAGSFKTASESVLQDRIIKTARRRIHTPGMTEGNTKNAFTGFGGFSKPSNTLTANTKFKFLSNLKNVETNTTKTNGLNMDNSTDGNKNNDQKLEVNSSTNMLKFKSSSVFADSSKKTEKSSDYCTKLKALNECVSQWIKSHVDVNPVCILTPIFKDYEKHLSEIENTYGKKEQNLTSESSDSEIKSSLNSKPSTSGGQKIASNFSFGDKKTLTNNKPNNESFQFGQKTDSEKSKIGETTKSIFGNSPLLKMLYTGEKEKNDTSPGSHENKTTPFVTPFSNTAAFSFGNKNLNTSPKGFSFDSEKPFTFSNVSAPNKTDAEKNEEVHEENDEPPKVEFTPVVENGSIYNIKCKVFAKKDSEFVERGVGQLYLKPVDGSDKTQLIVRADTNLGNLIINTLILKSMPTTKKGNNIIIVCIPTPESKPPPVTLLIKVKTSEDADKLIELLEKHKK